jgi:AbrB family looped-hinge helix DNA binding protein
VRRGAREDSKVSGKAPRAVVRGKNQITLPREVVEALRVREGDEVEFTVDEAGRVTVRGMTLVPTDQAWFWDPEWQQGEREASEQIAGGRTETFADAETMFDGVDAEVR